MSDLPVPCANCGRPVRPSKAIWTRQDDDAEPCCCKECYQQHEDEGCPMEHGGYRDNPKLLASHAAEVARLTEDNDAQEELLKEAVATSRAQAENFVKMKRRAETAEAERDAAVARAGRAEADASQFCAEAVRAEEALADILAFIRMNEPRHLAHAAGIIRDIAVKCKRALATAQDAKPNTSAVVSKTENAERAQRLVEALTPSAETKAAYIGEFTFTSEIADSDGEPLDVKHYVPWTTIKEIMKAIRERAALAEAQGGEEDV